MSTNAIHGKGAIIYLSAGAGAASPLAEQLDWSIDFEMALVDVTPLNNTWKSFVKGLMGWTGTFSGNFDSTSKTLWNAAVATVPSTMYLYPLGTADMTKYYSGTGWVVPGKLAAGSTTSKASSSFKMTGQDALATT